MKEGFKDRLKETIELAMSLPFTAFTTGTRKEIGKRDHWECQGVDGDCFWERVNGQRASHQTGFYVEAAHYHGQERDNDTNTSNGRILCGTCHAIEHLQQGDEKSARLILQHGVFTWDGAQEHGSQITLSTDKLKKIIEG